MFGIPRYGLGAALLLAFVGLQGCGDRASDSGAEGASYYEEGPSRHDDGSGRFYMGREIARITGHGEADWLDRPSRESTELPARVLMGVELSPADVVADIGAGTGYFTLRLSRKVPHGRVYAVDVQQEMLTVIERKVLERGYDNVVTVLGTPRDPNLPSESIDVAMLVDSYHEFSHPHEMITNIVASLKPGGQLILVEYRGEDPTIPVREVHRMTEAQAKLEMAAVGLVWRETKDILPQQHFMVFEKPLD